MNRLTDESVLDDENIKFVEDKLEYADKMKAIEEEIEIPLIALFDIYNKLCEQKFVYMKIGYQIKCFEYNHYVIDFKNKEIIGMEYEPDIWLSFKDYGIIWALSREELEENETSI